MTCTDKVFLCCFLVAVAACTTGLATFWVPGTPISGAQWGPPLVVSALLFGLVFIPSWYRRVLREEGE